MWKKALLFGGGVLASAVLQGAAKAPSVRRAAACGVAKCMDISDGIQSTTQSILDEAEDIRAEAKLRRQIDAAVAEKIAGIEEEVREEIRAKVEEAYAEPDEDAVDKKKGENAADKKKK
jgi:phage gp29-like protein